MNNSLYGEHTQMLLDEMVRLSSSNIDYDYNNIIAFINSDAFDNYSKRLLTFYNNKVGESFTPAEAAKDFLHRCSNHKITFNRGTANNWFTSGKYPKYGDNYRDNLFLISFVLDLSVDETERLFNTVYLDKAFNLRNPKEFVYLYCIINGQDYSSAQRILFRVESSSINISNPPLETRYIGDNVWKLNSDEEIIEFIVNNKDSFNFENQTPNRYLDYYISQLTGTSDNPGLAAQEAMIIEDAELLKYKSMCSLDFMLYMLYDREPAKKYSDVIDINLLFRSEISNQFPEKRIFSGKNNSSYILRKQIILVFFYWYWVNDYLNKENITGSYYGFLSAANNILYDCGMSPLYPSNPYDWLFLFSSSSKMAGSNPLDVFRGILNEKNFEY